VHELKDEPPSVKPDDAVAEAESEPAEAPQDPITTLAEAIAGLTEEIKAHHARAAARERVIDNLHAEVERLRIGERSLALRPVITDLQRMRTDLLRQAEDLPDEISRAQVAELLESFALTAEQTLERCGVVPIHPEVGTRFSARQHRAMKVLSTENPDLDETIAEVRADGYHDIATDRVTDPARVVVWRWTPENVPENAQEEQAEDG
jgi:molecular chaperone GrpE